ncbi:ABC transporter substrate-binding protein [Parazoarcus communis]|uniref:ABC transporter substrate-binding protein n=1 Tax=Parazoarcus communis SWub3 = DSM 12120 TaxID=1121029 RepID=A0A323UP26_9RHOO|nr:ABC transporter substrate-binding protein [Parazoarcus communis]NMG72703.1 ABC transporter substrate-binding protein [Parazoarcus communis SWub3 = DSM 12120]PZA14722.1 ABC transporter substrate-binding protein [Azoarcus communis] [Parazoarcus communis SWub3 = DSM 12120]
MKKRLACIAATLATVGLFSTPALAADEIRIGFLTTLSGPGAALGTDVRDGFKLALTHHGDKLGGLPVVFNLADDNQNPQTGRQNVERFLKRDKVDVVSGVVFSNVLLPVLPEILKNDTVYLSTNTGPRDYAAEKCDPNFFALAWQNEDIPAAMGKFATEKGYKRVAMIAPNYPGGRESLDGFKRLYKGEIVEELYTKLGQLDYASELATIRVSKPDAVFFFLPGGMGVNFIKQFDGAGLGKQMALLAPGFSADEDTIKAVGESIVGLYNASQWAADLENAPNKRFVADFVQTYGRIPTMYAAQAYDAALLLDSAVKKIGGKIEDKAAFRAALKAAEFQSIRGNFRFNNNQYPIQDLYMREVVKTADGKVTNRTVGTVLTAHADHFAGECPMK